METYLVAIVTESNDLVVNIFNSQRQKFDVFQHLLNIKNILITKIKIRSVNGLILNHIVRMIVFVCVKKIKEGCKIE